MNRRQISLLSVTGAVLLAAVLLGSVWFTYFTGRPDGWELPPLLNPDPPAGEPTAEPGPGSLSHTPLVVDARNIQMLLTQTVKRPGAYSQTIHCTYYWPGGEETFTHYWSRRGELTRVETRQEGADVLNLIKTPLTSYIWIGNSMPYNEISPEGADAEHLARIPTWETVLNLPLDNILFAETVFFPGESCLRVLTDEAVYLGEYIVSMETGLLVSASFTGKDGALAFSCAANAPVLAAPADERFQLPDGTLLG
jgi:hypothetical protein